MKARNLCTDCMNYVPNGEVCKCQSKEPALLKACEFLMSKKGKRAIKKRISEYPFRGAGIVFSSEIDVFND